MRLLHEFRGNETPAAPLALTVENPLGQEVVAEPLVLVETVIVHAFVMSRMHESELSAPGSTHLVLAHQEKEPCRVILV